MRAQPRSGAVSSILALCSVLVLAAVVKQPLTEVARLGYYSILKRDFDEYYSLYTLRLYNAGDEIAAARYVAAHSSTNQGLFVWGSDALYFLADRPNPSRFTFAMPLTLPGPYREAYRSEAMRDLTARPPTYFVTGIAWDGLSKAATEIADFPALADFFKQHYSLEKSIGLLDLYRLRDDARGSDVDTNSQTLNASQDVGTTGPVPTKID
jgi:hypothetical protein